MKHRVGLILLAALFTACTASLTTEDYKAMRIQIEHVDDVIVGNFDLQNENLRWADIMSYLVVNEPATHNMFEKYEVEFFVKENSYLLLLLHPCDRHIVMYDYSCTSGKLDGALYETNSHGSLREINAPDCAKDKCYIR